MVPKLARYHFLSKECCFEKVKAFFEIILQLLDRDEESELISVKRLVDKKVGVGFIWLSYAADAFQGEESLDVRFKAAFNPFNATEPRGKQTEERI